MILRVRLEQERNEIEPLSAQPEGTDMTDELLAWHFTGDKLRDGRLIPALGEWLVHDGPIRICDAGLHASERLIDALRYAPGETLHRVTVRGIEDRQDDKLVARERRIEWSLDAEPVLRAFSRRCALDVLPLWPDAPEIVRRYLETGDESIRDAAWDAARAAAWAAARDAARDAAWLAAWHAARDAARDASISKYNDWLTEMVEAAHAEERT